MKDCCQSGFLFISRSLLKEILMLCSSNSHCRYLRFRLPFPPQFVAATSAHAGSLRLRLLSPYVAPSQLELAKCFPWWRFSAVRADDFTHWICPHTAPPLADDDKPCRIRPPLLPPFLPAPAFSLPVHEGDLIESRPRNPPFSSGCRKKTWSGPPFSGCLSC